MNDPVLGVHHITAMAGGGQANLDFYVGVLGLRLVKSTVNFDDPGTRHFYFGDAVGSPGTVLTFFPSDRWSEGKRGAGEVRIVAFEVGSESLGWWSRRLTRLGVACELTRSVFGEETLGFDDPDGLRLELVAIQSISDGRRRGGSVLSAEHAIGGFHSAELVVGEVGATSHLLGAMGFSAAGLAEGHARFNAGGAAAGHGRILKLVTNTAGSRARLGRGSVHHIAFRVADNAALERWRAILTDSGLNPTPIVNRHYFHSIYFREPGGVIFEFATDGPGFAIDELEGDLGHRLTLPPWLEARRTEIESRLPPVGVPRPVP